MQECFEDQRQQFDIFTQHYDQPSWLAFGEVDLCFIYSMLFSVPFTFNCLALGTMLRL